MSLPGLPSLTRSGRVRICQLCLDRRALPFHPDQSREEVEFVLEREGLAGQLLRSPLGSIRGRADHLDLLRQYPVRPLATITSLTDEIGESRT